MKTIAGIILFILMILTLGYKSQSQSDILKIFLNNGSIDSLTMSNIRVVQILEKPDPPTLIYPKKDSLKIAVDDTLKWNASTGAVTYNIQICEDPTFVNDPIEIPDIETTYFDFSLDYNTKYYWRVNAENSNGTSDWSETWNFRTKLEDIVLTAPDTNAKSRPLNETLSWNTCSGANRYRVQISTHSNFDSTVVDSQAHTTTSFVCSGLTNNIKYYWRIKARSSIDNESNWSAVRSFTTKLATATLISPADSSVAKLLSDTLKWNRVSGANKYHVTVSKSQSVYIPGLDSMFIADSVLIYRNFINNQDYFWKVQALTNDSNTSDFSNIWKFTTELSQPQLLSPLNDTLSQELNDSLKWQLVSGANSYIVWISTSSSFTDTVKYEQSITTNKYYYNGLNYNTKYYWKVIAKTTAGNRSRWSDVWNFRTKLITPVLTKPQSNSIAIALTDTLFWQSSNGASSYILQIARDSSFTDTVSNLSNISNLNYVLNNLENNTKYYWRIKAQSSNGNTSSWTPEWNFITMLANPELILPANDALARLFIDSLQWQTVQGASRYNIQISTVSNFVTPFKDTTVSSQTFYIYHGMEVNTKYYWRVKAENELGNYSEWSSARNFKTKLTEPELLSPANNSEKIDIDGNLIWKSLPGNVSYNIQISEYSNFSEMKIDTSSYDTVFTYNGLKTSTIYYWRIKAESGDNLSGWSSVWNFKTKKTFPRLSSPYNDAMTQNIDGLLLWDSLADASSYRVQLSKDSLFSGQIVFDSLSIKETMTEYASLLYNNKYYWRVIAIYNQDSSDWSQVWNYRTELEQPVLESPSDNAVSQGTNGTVSWKNVSGANSYQLLTATDTTFKNPKINQSGITKNSYDYTSLDNSTTYYWCIRASTEAGNESRWSEIREFKTSLTAPKLKSPYNNRKNVKTLAFEWYETKTATSYNFQLSEDSGFQTIVDSVKGISSLKYNCSKELGYSKEYFWRLSASTGTDTSPWSDIYKFTTQGDGNITPAIYLSKASVLQGDTIIITGKNFSVTGKSELSFNGPGSYNFKDTIDLSDTGFLYDYITTKANSSGYYTLTATDIRSGKKSQKQFRIQAFEEFSDTSFTIIYPTDSTKFYEGEEFEMLWVDYLRYQEGDSLDSSKTKRYYEYHIYYQTDKDTGFIHWDSMDTKGFLKFNNYYRFSQKLKVFDNIKWLKLKLIDKSRGDDDLLLIVKSDDGNGGSGLVLRVVNRVMGNDDLESHNDQGRDGISQFLKQKEQQLNEEFWGAGSDEQKIGTKDERIQASDPVSETSPYNYAIFNLANTNQIQFSGKLNGKVDEIEILITKRDSENEEDRIYKSGGYGKKSFSFSLDISGYKSNYYKRKLRWKERNKNWSEWYVREFLVDEPPQDGIKILFPNDNKPIVIGDILRINWEWTRAEKVYDYNIRAWKLDKNGRAYDDWQGTPTTTNFYECKFGSLEKRRIGIAIRKKVDDSRYSQSDYNYIVGYSKWFTVDFQPQERETEPVTTTVEKKPATSNDFKVEKIWDKTFTSESTGNPKGVVADGVSRIYLRLTYNGSQPIESIRVSLSDNISSKTKAILGKIMVSKYKILSDLSYSNEGNDANSISIEDDGAKEQKERLYCYVAPDDFARDQYELRDRIVSANITIRINGEDIPLPIEKIEIVRPPLLLVHGLGGNPDTWGSSDPEKEDGFKHNGYKFRTDWIFFGKYTPPELNNHGGRDIAVNYCNDCSYSTNGQNIITLIKQRIGFFRKLGYAANRVDYVGHSMGGLIIRVAERRSEFKCNDNYQYGFVNKLITTDSPHNGSPFANYLNNVASKLKKNILFKSAYALQKPKTLKSWYLRNPNGSYRNTDAVSNLRLPDKGGYKISYATEMKSHLIFGNYINTYPSIPFTDPWDIFRGFEIISGFKSIDEEIFKIDHDIESFIDNSDLIVRVKSQNCNFVWNSSGVAGVCHSNVNKSDFSDFSGNKAFELLNSSIHNDALWGNIPANSVMGKSDDPEDVKIVEVDKEIKPKLLSTPTIEILEPENNSTFMIDDYITTKIDVSDTLGLQGVQLYYQGNLFSDDSIKYNYEFDIPVSGEIIGYNPLIAAAYYEFSDTTFAIYAQLETEVISNENITSFDITPKTFSIPVGQSFKPEYKAIFETFISDIGLSKDLNVEYSVPDLVVLDSTNSFIGLKEGDTRAIIDYKGLKDTLYITVEPELQIPSISIIRPEAEEKVIAGIKDTIIWESKYLDTLRIEFSTDNGVTWDTLQENSLVTSSDNQVFWDVPIEAISDSCYIKITDINDSLLYWTSDMFRIVDSTVSVEDDNMVNYQLLDCKPNPFTNETEISFSMGKPGNVKLTISEMTGREIMVLTDNYLNEGTHTVKFKADKYNLANGSYLYTLTVNGFIQTKHMVLIK